MLARQAITVLILLAASGGPALALDDDQVRKQWDLRRPVPILPLTLQDITGKSSIELSLILLPAEDVFGLAMKLGGQYSTDLVDIGVAVPMAMAVVDEHESEFVLGNPTANVRVRHCFEGEVQVCVGGDLAAGFGAMEVVVEKDVLGVGSADEEPSSRTVLRQQAWAAGLLAYQDPTCFVPESAVIRPLALGGIVIDDFSSQVEVAPAILVPLFNTAGRETEAMLLYRLSVGYRLAKWVAPLLELSGLSPVTDGLEGDTRLFLNLGARFEFKSGSFATKGGIQPALRVSVPLEAHDRGQPYVQVYLGLTHQFGPHLKGPGTGPSLLR